MSGMDSCPGSSYLFIEGGDGTWQLGCEETGQMEMVFERREEALGFANELMDEAGPWRIVFRKGNPG